jgi:hypothetical protein
MLGGGCKGKRLLNRYARKGLKGLTWGVVEKMGSKTFLGGVGMRGGVLVRGGGVWDEIYYIFIQLEGGR